HLVARPLERCQHETDVRGRRRTEVVARWHPCRVRIRGQHFSESFERDRRATPAVAITAREHSAYGLVTRRAVLALYIWNVFVRDNITERRRLGASSRRRPEAGSRTSYEFHRVAGAALFRPPLARVHVE